MNPADKSGFFADRARLDMARYLVFDYRFETAIAPEEAAAHLCQEQSTAQWKRVGVQEDLRERFGAKVIDLQIERRQEAPSFPSAALAEGAVDVCRVKIAHPHGNFGPKLPNILTAACGEGAFFRREFRPSSCWTSSSPTRFWRISRGLNSGSRVCAACCRSMIDRFFSA